MTEFKKSTKIVHLCTNSGGGAANAAYRIHESLLSIGINSTFICLNDNAYSTDLNLSILTMPSVADRNNHKYNLFEKIQWRLKKHFNLRLDKREYFTHQLQKIENKLVSEGVGSLFSDVDVLQDERIKNCDIIHLHWVTGMVDFPTFFKYNNKPIVWTFHDMNPFQGLFHYYNDILRNASISKVLTEQLRKYKKQIVRGSKTSISIVTPSSWLMLEAKKSKVFDGADFSVIPYPLNLSTFTPRDILGTRQGLNISLNTTIFLFVSESIENYRKGFDLLLDAFKNLNNNNITLLVIGKTQIQPIIGIDIKMIGTIHNDEILSEYYSLADAFIIPSREDNLPNVMLESMACGTPVISFDIGGMSETIIEGFNGMKAKSVKSGELEAVIIDFIAQKENFKKLDIRKWVESKFENRIIANKYSAVYTKHIY